MTVFITNQEIRIIVKKIVMKLKYLNNVKFFSSNNKDNETFEKIALFNYYLHNKNKYIKYNNFEVNNKYSKIIELRIFFKRKLIFTTKFFFENSK